MASADSGEELLKCAKENLSRRLRDLIDTGVDPNYENKNGETAVWFASRNVCLDCLRVLIEKKANLDAQLRNGNVTGLWIAAANGHIEVIQTLLDGGADPEIPDSRGVTALWTATSYGFYEIVKLLIDSRCNYNATRSNGESCLWVACQSNFRQIVELLIGLGADSELARDDGHTPLMAAAEGGFVDIVKILIDYQANIEARCTDGQTALSLAACNGHDSVVKLLLSSGDNPDIDESDSSTVCPLAQSCAYDRRSTARLLWDRVSEQQRRHAIEICKSLGNEELADLLHPEASLRSEQKPACSSLQPVDMNELSKRMSEAGFTRERSRVQTAAADVVQGVYRSFFQKKQGNNLEKDSRTIFILGSFGDGWGCNLSSVDGSVSRESDIDFTEIMLGQSYHIQGACQCAIDEGMKYIYKNGHIRIKRSVVSQPAMTTQASHVTPSMDIVYSYAACGYPEISMLASVEDKEHFPDEVLQKLCNAVKSPKYPCHLIRAGTPNKEGTQLRVSTSILERIVLRSLTTEQGQFYIILKYIVKKVLGIRTAEHESFGLKSYHAKSIQLFMLKKTPKEAWKTENFRTLLITALHMLRNYMTEKSNIEEYCMPHFFLKDTILFFKKDHYPKCKIVEHINHVIGNIDRYITEFRDQLKPLEDPGYLSVHPFALFPFGFSLICDQESTDAYHNAYIRIKRILMELIKLDRPLSQNFMLELDKIPSFANTAKICLRVLALMRLGDEEAARKVLLDNQSSRVLRNLTIKEGLSKTKTREAIWSQLTGHDTLWRICCRMGHGTVDCIRFAPDRDQSINLVCRACFPSVLPFHERRVYLNFVVLLYLLRMSFSDSPDQAGSATKAFLDDVRGDWRSADFEELHAVALITDSTTEARQMLKEMLKRYDKRHVKTDEVIRHILTKCSVRVDQLGQPRLHHDSSAAVCLLNRKIMI
ncbi:hypothetical protein BOX15_Mlig022265g5 [Macrostomum lignano]|uniref:Mab-21-like HhH/H2TH-like domain-containing protein n=1 Tax=Macrostomum lignano TaxID=282301 RepID=A0A267FXT7_9PLAT|nr:hypothetical protein BOX15_Mlig022265g1 [Macrostomum lignano]PAA78648.1 hypothetical protein BOX15_Mlig022265g5 [Macrostomum lignano]